MEHFIKENFGNLSNKTLRDEKLTLVDGGKVITEDKNVVKNFRNHFEKIVDS